jgi:hypothetical protein
MFRRHKAKKMPRRLSTAKRPRGSAGGRVRDVVYVIGAGFSAGLGYPLTKDLLTNVWTRLGKSDRRRLEKVIVFHHPRFDAARKRTFPDIELLLTEIAVNLELFDASRPAEGNFRRAELEDLQEALLSAIGMWFHELSRDALQVPWLHRFVERIHAQNAGIVSFNWDLILDQELFEKHLTKESYGLGGNLSVGPFVLKPHGSLNWYGKSQISKVAAEKRTEIVSSRSAKESVEAFLPYREIRTSVGRRYMPLIIPPTFIKDFDKPIFRKLWQRCTDVLSTPRELIFLGYSLPLADQHAQFIFRCGFHNQLEGRLNPKGGRYRPTGAAEVTIVNPDREAAKRIQAVAGPRFQCKWIPKRISEWL